ncbi:aldo/keto reductase [Halomonas sp. 18H]|uniref:aldo/keto reductase n=1 Tax=Halomonas almeriensis TaxID=308163 RepID=UPI0022307245|nr:MULTISPECIES: aldo/keto reductase [Halomonas]MCW4149262.1 aldo/keto reductase [Halomonas sp. 18H]MDN3552185.1 aldo/keto reductase [Halomonas almeriensis]
MSNRPEVTLAATSRAPAVTLPAIGQGTWYMGEGHDTHQEEVTALQAGLDHGLSLIDTAEMYAEGQAERIVGDALKNRRDEAFLTSKVYPWNAGRDSAIQACENSLRRLGTDYLDLYLLHWPGGIALDETLEAFERLQQDGKIRRFGVSNFDVEEMRSLVEMPGGNDCATNQVLYHLGSRGIEYSLLPWHRKQELPVMAYCPLAQGGRLRRDLLDHPDIMATAAELDLTPAQLLLAWSIRPIDGQRHVMAIPKAVDPQHIQENAAALNVVLDDDTLANLNSIFPPPVAREPLDTA